MISLSSYHPGVVRQAELHQLSVAARLLRAGFKDQERAPRLPFHWANR